MQLQWVTVKLTDDYAGLLKERAKSSHAYRKHQLVGLEIAVLLEDEKHKSLYIKLSKEADGDALLAVAKDVSTRENIEHKGAYFMRVVKERGMLPKRKPRKKRSKK